MLAPSTSGAVWPKSAALSITSGSSDTRTTPLVTPGKRGSVTPNLLPLASELQFRYYGGEADGAERGGRSAERQRELIVKLLATWEEVVEMQEQYSYWSRPEPTDAVGASVSPSKLRPARLTVRE